MIGCLRTHVRKQPIIVLYFEFENELKFYNLGTRSKVYFDPKLLKAAYSVTFDLSILELMFVFFKNTVNN